MLRIRTITGFTLIELLLTTSVAAVTLSIAIPLFMQFVVDMKEKAAASALMDAIRQARSEALTRNTPVTICRSSQELDACNHGDGGWSDGWLIFADPDGDMGRIDNGERILHRHEALDSGIAIVPEGAVADYIRFSSSGRPSATGSMSLAADGTAYTLTVTSNGRIAYETQPEEGRE